MPSFSFHVCAAASAPLLVQQCDAPTLNDALAAANNAARVLVQTLPRRSGENIRGSLDVRDAGERTVARVMFADGALRLR